MATSGPAEAASSSEGVRFQRLRSDEDVAAWRQSPSYGDFLGWVLRRADRIKGKRIAIDGEDDEACPESSAQLLQLLSTLESWIEEAPPQKESQRFGNRAFRRYILLVEERLPAILPPILQDDPHSLALLLASHAFGHPVRLDYGSGHELSFVLVLHRLVRIGRIARWSSRKGKEREDSAAGDEERIALAEDDLVLRVFPRYLELTTRLQKVYNLEPAGSHGVWGLDDFIFLPYLWGAAQLLGTDTTPQQALANARNPAMQPQDLWTMSLRRVFEFKSGPFHEHSPLLHSLSSMPSFVKISSGLVKMYQEEVLGKLVVVQHLWLEPWDPTGRRPTETLPPELLRSAHQERKIEREDKVDEVNKVWKEMQAGGAMLPPPIQGVQPATLAPWRR